MTTFKRFNLLVALVMIVAALSMPSAAQQRVHVIRAGETLASIATAYGTNVASIVAANGIVNPNVIYAGQALIIPSGITVPNTGGTGSVGSTIRYTVQAGDTLSVIASRYGVTVSAIVNINAITVSTVLRPGQVLLIPSTLPGTGSQQPPVIVQPPVVTPPVYRGWHYVLPGQTMLQIARLYGRDAWNIARANGIYNLNRIYSGTWLRIP